MDLLVIAVDAGLGFDAALARVTDKYKNALSDMFAKVLREVSLGRPRLEAMDEMGRQSGVDDLHNFIQAIIQSEQFGTGIGKILRIQADEMRRKRRQRAQEKAAQATLKMMLPMVGSHLPDLWIVLLRSHSAEDEAKDLRGPQPASTCRAFIGGSWSYGQSSSRGNCWSASAIGKRGLASSRSMTSSSSCLWRTPCGRRSPGGQHHRGGLVLILALVLTNFGVARLDRIRAFTASWPQRQP